MAKDSSSHTKHQTTKQSAKKTTATTTQQPTTNATTATKQSFKQSLADAILLLSNSPLHKYMFLADLEATVLPALRANQYRLFQADGITVAFALWAKLSDDVHQRLLSGVVRLAPHEWSSGEHIWLMDVIAPAGKERIILDELKRSVFVGQRFMLQRFDEQGRPAPEEIIC